MKRMKDLITHISRHQSLFYLFSLILGLMIGLLTIYGQKYLPGNLNSLANLGPVWLLPAFFVSSQGKHFFSAIFSCFLCLIGSVMGYYIFLSFINQYTFRFDYFIVIWLVCAMIGGVIFGIAGYLWQHPIPKYHSLGSALISGVFLSDGINMLLRIEHYEHMLAVPIAEVLFGLVLILILENDKQQRRQSYLYLIPVIACGLVGYGVLFLFT